MPTSDDTDSLSDAVTRTTLKYQSVFVSIAPLLFIVAVYFFAPTPAEAGTDYWLDYWWLFPCFLLGATIVNTIGISGSALFVPFLIFIFPLFAHPLEPKTLVKIGLISEAFGLSSSAIAFIQYGLVDRRLALTLVLGGIPFVVGGAFLSFFVPEAVFHALLALALVVAAYLLFKIDLDHGEPEGHSQRETAADGGQVNDAGLPNDDDKLGAAGVHTDEEGAVTRVDREGGEYFYSRSGYLKRFATYGVGGVFQGLAGFGIGELGIISTIDSKIPVRVAIGSNHIVVAVTAIVASLVHIFAGGLVGAHTMSLATTPWNMVVFTVPATATGGQLAPYVSAALDTGTLKKGVGVLFTAISVALFAMAAGFV